MQHWTGTFAWDNQCKSNYCCCYAGKLIVTNSGSDLIFTSETRGCGSSEISYRFSNPNSYSFSTTGTRGAQITYRLSSDGNTLTVKNDAYNYCGGSASRTSAGEYIYPSAISFIIFFAGLWILL